MPVVRELTTRLGYKIDDKDLKKYDSQTKGLTSALGGLATAAAAAGVALAGMLTGALVKGIYETNVEFERLMAMLKTATGSVALADEQFKKLQQFGATTPFQLNEVVNAFIKLKNLGLDPGMEALTDYGNIATAMGKSLDQFIEAVADASTGEFERLKEFGIKARKQGDQVSFTFKGVTTTVKNDAAAITDYLRSISQQNFGTAMSDQMKTLPGLISNMKDNVDSFFRTIGQAGVNEALRRLITAFVGVQGQTGSLATFIGQKLSVVIEGLAGLIERVMSVWDQWVEGMQHATKVMQILPINVLLLLVEDLFGFLAGKESLIGDIFNQPVIQDFITWLRQLQSEIMPEFVKLFDELGTAVMDLVITVFPSMKAEGGDTLGTIINIMKQVILMFLSLAKFAIQAFTVIVKVVDFFAPAILFILDGMFGGIFDLIGFLVDAFKFAFDAIIFAWEFSVNQFTALLNLLTGDIDGAIKNWTDSLRGFTELLGSIGIDISDITGQPATPAGNATVGQSAAAAPAGGAGETTVTSNATVGSVNVTVEGTTNMGPGETAAATKTGVTKGMEQVSKDISRNTAGAVT